MIYRLGDVYLCIGLLVYLIVYCDWFLVTQYTDTLIHR